MTETRRFWPEPDGVRGKPDGTVVTVTGELAYLLKDISRQGFPFATGMLRMAGDGEVPIEVPPIAYAGVGGLLAEGDIITVTGRIDRRSPIHLLSVHDVLGPARTGDTSKSPGVPSWIPTGSSWLGAGSHEGHTVTKVGEWADRIEGATVEFRAGEVSEIRGGTLTSGRVRCSCAEEWDVGGWPIEGVRAPKEA